MLILTQAQRKKTMDEISKKIIYEGFEIEHHIGYNFIKFILEDNTDIIIEFIKNTIDKYSQ